MQTNAECFLPLTNEQTMIPPVVVALLKLEFIPVDNVDGLGRIGDGPGCQVDGHHEENGKEPLQELLIGELDLVG